MTYIGSKPATSFVGLSSQSFTGGSGTSFTLNKSVSSTSDIAVFVNNVRQNPTDSSYSVSGTTLTMSATIATTDKFYVVFLGATTGTIIPPTGSVGLAQLSASGTKSSSTFFRGDNSFASISTTPNAPMFLAYLSSDTAVTNNARTKIQADTEVFDTAGNYDNSTNFRFTPTVAGKYYVFGQVEMYATNLSNCAWVVTEIRRNGTSNSSTTNAYQGYTDHRNNYGDGGNAYAGGIFEMNGSSDYIELYSYPSFTSGTPTAAAGLDGSYFGAFKLGV
jgi:hypothetical protein